jgi:hypothetical protein
VIRGASSGAKIAPGAMAYTQRGSDLLNGVASVGGRAAAATLRPFSGAVGAAAEVGMTLERRAVDRLLENGDLERLLAGSRMRAVVEQVLESDGVKALIDTFFDSGVFDHFVQRLLASDALWHLVDDVAASPAVTAAISQQGLGFADQLGEEMRARSRRADDRLERVARRLVNRRTKAAAAAADPAPP